jgi:RNA polymerase sigma factor (sigma-70 family)
VRSTSATLLGRLRDLGDERAWQEFQARYQPRLLAWCRDRGMQEAAALDLVQEVLLRVVRHIGAFDYDPAQNFSGWLRTVWSNAWLDALKKRREVKGSGDSAVQEQLERVVGGDLNKELEEVFEREQLHEALARVRPRVKPRDWDIFHNLVFAGKSATEVARERGMTRHAVGMVKTRVQRLVSQEVARLEGVE